MWHEPWYLARMRLRSGQASIFGLLLVGGVALGLLGARTTQTSSRHMRAERPAGVRAGPSVPPAVNDRQLHVRPSQLHPSPLTFSDPDVRAVLNQYCVVCHNQTAGTAGLAFDTLDVANPTARADTWERVIRKLRMRTMPPAGMPRPDPATYDMVVSWLEGEIDRAWAANPNPGRSNAVHRLNRTEYNNAVRDLLALDIDVRALLPGDDTADGSFDNVADVLSITTAHLERYMTVARQVTRLAVGIPPTGPGGRTFEIPLYVDQDDRQSEGLPFGTRGGIAVPYHFPVNGEYLIKVRLRRNYQAYLMGMGWPQQLDVRLDGKLMNRFTVGGGAAGRPATGTYAGAGFGDPEWEEYMQVAGDASLEVRAPVEAGPRVVGVAFVRELWKPEGVRQPLQRGRMLPGDEGYMDYAAVQSVEILGPYSPSQDSGLAEDTPSRREIFVCHPRLGAEEEACATQILSRMARRAYRRSATNEEAQTLLEFFTMGREDGGSFDAGIQFALERLLSGPQFLLRFYPDPPAVAPERVYRLSDLEVASRLSFFLWSSIPDEQLLDVAEQGQLTDPLVLEQQVRRMLADPRATNALVNDFAAQWLNLRRLTGVTVDDRFYPNYDDNLLEAFQRESELFIASTLREDRSVLALLSADYTYLNERLARHYGIPQIYGSRFRRVTFPDLEQRGGLLAQGALLTVSSYPDRTSPVLRGKWLLDNLLGSPPPPPPPNVNTNLEEDPDFLPASIRERLAQHRNDPVCSSCHSIIDPLGFALENFDALGGWRTVDEWGNPVDPVGTMPSGVEVRGLVGLRAYLLDRPEVFVGTVTEKLMAYSLGQRLEYYDQPAVRQIVRDAAAHEYRWSSIILGIVKSPAFLMRRVGSAAN